MIHNKSEFVKDSNINYQYLNSHHTSKIKKIRNQKELEEVVGHITTLQEAIDYEEGKIKAFWGR